jgi:hypothetical protein
MDGIIIVVVVVGFSQGVAGRGQRQEEQEWRAHDRVEYLQIQSNLAICMMVETWKNIANKGRKGGSIQVLVLVQALSAASDGVRTGEASKNVLGLARPIPVIALRSTSLSS